MTKAVAAGFIRKNCQLTHAVIAESTILPALSNVTNARNGFVTVAEILLAGMRSWVRRWAGNNLHSFQPYRQPYGPRQTQGSNATQGWSVGRNFVGMLQLRLPQRLLVGIHSGESGLGCGPAVPSTVRFPKQRSKLVRSSAFPSVTPTMPRFWI